MLEIYSLSVDSLKCIGEETELEIQVDTKLDSERLRIVKRLSENMSGRATARCAGLLLQYVGSKKMLMKNHDMEYQGSQDETELEIIDLSVTDILNVLHDPIDFKYRHGSEGKPYWADENMPYFNVSHSANMVVLVVSDVEIGIDIQKIKAKNELNMARRFYSEKEATLVEASQDMGYEMFYKLWARKEALGKCMGNGVRPYLDTDVSDLDGEYVSQYIWNETRIDDYFICICRRK